MTPFMGQLVLASFNFPPKNFALCNGQLMAINQNQALYSLLGTTYGGNGTTTFGLPDMRGRTGLSTGTLAGQSYTLGQISGTETVTLQTTNIPTHTHTLTVSNLVTTPNPNASPIGATVTSQATGVDNYSTTSNNFMAGGALGNAGGSQPHENRFPFLTLNWFIALTGVFPTRN